MKKKLALVGPWDRLIWEGRRGIIVELIKRGWEVVAISSEIPNGGYAAKIRGLGARFVPVEVARFVDPIKDLRYFLFLLRFFRRERFDVVHSFTIKPNLMAPLAAKITGTPKIVGFVEGLGTMYDESPGFKPWLKRKFLCLALRFGFLFAERIWFMNSDDLKDCLANHVVPKKKAVLITSCGVDLAAYSSPVTNMGAVSRLREELGRDGANFFVVTVARVNWHKGVKEFVEASQIVGRSHPNVKFLWVGGIQQGTPLVVDKEYLKRAEGKNFQWLGFWEDLNEVLELADVFALPTFYREGVPAVILQAMAHSKPIIATDWVGCREVVRAGGNGILIPIKDSQALADAVIKLLTTPKLREDMGRKSYSMILDEFEERYIVAQVMRKLYDL
jgi:N,N'-diacetylbacillosaminyl-diphospho-undecaprenol alpha-1,3-N-acetylgalactosaminyltransferase